jgi:hypothetical protein
MNQHPALVAERSDDFPENDRLTEAVFSDIVRRETTD